MSVNPLLWTPGPCPWPVIEGECRQFEIQRLPAGSEDLARDCLACVAWRSDVSGVAMVLMGDVCRRPGATWWRIGCENRHVEERLFCPDHAAGIQRLDRTMMMCAYCQPASGTGRVMILPGRFPRPPGRVSLAVPSPDPVPGMEEWADPAMEAVR